MRFVYLSCLLFMLLITPSQAQTLNADVSLILSSDLSTVVVGQQVIINFQASNSGPDRVLGVTVIYILPNALDFVASQDCLVLDRVLTCAFGALGLGEQRDMDVVLIARQAGQLQTDARLIASQADLDDNNNHAQLDLDILEAQAVALELSLSDVSESIYLEGRGLVDVTVLNTSTTPAYDVVLEVILDESLTVRNLPETCTLSVQNLSCRIAELLAGQTTTWTLTSYGLALSDSSDFLAQVRASGIDEDLTDNLSTAVLQVIPTPPDGADLQLNLASSQAVPIVGQNITIIATLQNAGPTATEAVTLNITLPSELSYQGVDDTACTYIVPTVTCQWASMAVSASHSVHLEAQVIATSPSVAISASVTGQAVDYLLQNNQQTLLLTSLQATVALPTMTPLPTQTALPTQTPFIIAATVPVFVTDNPNPALATDAPSVANAGGSAPLNPEGNSESPSDLYGWQRFESADFIQVLGTWDLRTESNASDGAYHESRSEGALLRYPFTGDGFRIGYRSNVNGEAFQVFLDGVLHESVQTGYEFFVGRSDSHRATYVTEASFVSSGYHVIDIVSLADGAGQEGINIDFIEIFTGPSIPIVATATPLNPEPDSTAVIQYPLSPILIQSPPTALPTLVPIEEQLMVIDVTLAVDLNQNGIREPAEGIEAVLIQAIDLGRNTVLATAMTDNQGAAQFQLLSDNDIVLIIPLISASYTVRINRDGTNTWQLLLDPSQLPGLLP